MKILFVTGLHGNEAKYRRVFEAAQKHKVAAVINGGDMLTGTCMVPKGNL